MRLRTTKVYNLELNASEVKWLHGVMQNPLYGQHPTEEDLDERDLRVQLYEELGTIQTHGDV